MSHPLVQHISECFIKPKHSLDEHKRPLYLSVWDLNMLSVHYIQKGFLFEKPLPTRNHQTFNITDFLHKLKDSLSLTLVHFYPLSGRLVTSQTEEPPSYVVSVDCQNSPGAGFIHASVNLTISDITSPTYVPLVVQSFFDHDRAVNHDGHTMPLLTIQVTELLDGIFIGCSMNHCIVDGTSYWHVINAWSEIFQSKQTQEHSISRPPIIKPWFPEGYGPKISLPYTHPDQFIGPFEAPVLKERVFHFTTGTLTKLKAKANAEVNTINKISSFQSLSALLWRCITRARNLSRQRITSCILATNNRARLNPPLHANYFGNCISPMRTSTTVGELLDNSLGWSALMLHQSVVSHNDKNIKSFIESWLQCPTVYKLGQLFDPDSIAMGSSPRFEMYGNEFGLGKAVCLRSGYANKFSGKVSAYPGREGGGSIDLEICLPPDQMSFLEADNEFLDVVCLW